MTVGGSKGQLRGDCSHDWDPLPRDSCIPSLALEGSQHRLKMYRSQSPVICLLLAIQLCHVMRAGVAVGPCEKTFTQAFTSGAIPGTGNVCFGDTELRDLDSK